MQLSMNFNEAKGTFKIFQTEFYAPPQIVIVRENQFVVQTITILHHWPTEKIILTKTKGYQWQPFSKKS